MTWRENAACAGTDVHYDPDGREPEDARAHRVAEALALCAMCPTRDACLDFALDSERGTTGGRHGIWGGLTPEERQERTERAAAWTCQVCGQPCPPDEVVCTECAGQDQGEDTTGHVE